MYQKIGIINYLYLLSLFCAIVPLLQCKISAISKLFKIYALVCMGLGISEVLLNQISNVDYKYVTLLITFEIDVFALNAVYFVSTVMPVCLHRKCYLELLILFSKIDQLTSFKIRRNPPHLHVWLIFSLFLFWILNPYELYIRYLASGTFRYSGLNLCFKKFVFVIQIILMTNIIHCVTTRLSNINSNLEMLCIEYRTWCFQPKMEFNNLLYSIVVKVNQLGMAYKMIKMQIKLFNIVFGWQIFFIFFFLGSNILHYLNIMRLRKAEVLGKAMYTDLLILLNLLWAIYNLVKIIYCTVCRKRVNLFDTCLKCNLL